MLLLAMDDATRNWLWGLKSIATHESVNNFLFFQHLNGFVDSFDLWWNSISHQFMFSANREFLAKAHRYPALHKNKNINFEMLNVITYTA